MSIVSTVVADDYEWNEPADKVRTEERAARLVGLFRRWFNGASRRQRSSWSDPIGRSYSQSWVLNGLAKANTANLANESRALGAYDQFVACPGSAPLQYRRTDFAPLVSDAGMCLRSRLATQLDPQL